MTIGASMAPRVSRGVKLGYSAGLFGISMVQTSVAVLLMYFYTEVLRIPPVMAGLILATGTLVDAGASLGAAWVANRHRSALGRYRPILLAVSAPLSIFFALMFARPDLSGGWLWLYAATTHLCYRICYAFTLTPHSALIGCLSSDADERAAIGAWKAVANNLGLMVAGYLGISTIERLGSADPERGFLIFGVAFGAIAGLSVLTSALATRERRPASGLQHDIADLMPALRHIVRNSQMMVVLGATLLFFASYMLMSGGIVYLFRYVFVRPGDAKLAVIAIGLAGLVMPPLWSRMIRRTSKALVWSIGCLVMAATVALLWALGSQAGSILLALYFFVGVGKSAAIVNFYAMTADAVDHGEWRLGTRAEAYSFGMLALANKTGTALGGGLLGLLLAWSGLHADAVGSTPEPDRLLFALCSAPAILAIASAVVASRFAITAARHRTILQDLAARLDGRG